MNKLQYIKLLELRGVTKLNNETLGDALRRTGGDETKEEVEKVNIICNKNYNERIEQNKYNIKMLKMEIEEYEDLIINIDSKDSLTLDELKTFLLSDEDAAGKFTCGDNDLDGYKEIGLEMMEQEDCYSTWIRTCSYKGKEYSMYYSKDNKEQNVLESDSDIVNSIQEI